MWVNITNIGEPFNSAEDDYSFIITPDQKQIYLVRNGDIFYVNFDITNQAVGAAHE